MDRDYQQEDPTCVRPIGRVQSARERNRDRRSYGAVDIVSKITLDPGEKKLNRFLCYNQRR
jgi:hypothetical protein